MKYFEIEISVKAETTLIIEAPDEETAIKIANDKNKYMDIDEYDDIDRDYYSWGEDEDFNPDDGYEYEPWDYGKKYLEEKKR